MQVVGVEAIEVEGFSRALADAAEGDFAEAADLAEQVGDVAGRTQ